jgi:hypothetical protein
MSRQARKMAESYDRSAELRKFVDVIEEVAHRDLQD